jgi:hypothetical protein
MMLGERSGAERETGEREEREEEGEAQQGRNRGRARRVEARGRAAGGTRSVARKSSWIARPHRRQHLGRYRRNSERMIGCVEQRAGKQSAA